MLDKAQTIQLLKIDRSTDAVRGFGWRNRLLWGSVTAAMLIGLILGGFALAHEAPTVQVIDIPLKAPPSAGGETVLNVSGYVVALREATVSSQLTGMIATVYVSVGMRVRKGNIVARLDDRVWKATKAGAQNQVGADNAVVAQTEAELAKDLKNLARLTPLAKRNLVSRSDFENAQSSADIDEASLTHAKEQVAVDEDNLRIASINVENTVIRAPFDGVVTEIYAHPGEMISPAAVGGFTETGVCRLIDMGSLALTVDIAEASIQKLAVGQPVDVIPNAYPDLHVSAHVTDIVPTADREKATVRVFLGFDHLDKRVLPDMEVQANFEQGTASVPAQEAAFHPQIPSTAVHHDGDGTYVYVYEDGRVMHRAVGVGQSNGANVPVLSGLAGGEQIVTSSDSQLSDAESVRKR